MFSQGPARPSRRLSTALQSSPPDSGDGTHVGTGLIRNASLLADKVVNGNGPVAHEPIPSGSGTQSPNQEHQGGYGGLQQGQGQGQRNVDLKALLKTSRLEDVLFSLAYLITKENDLPPKITWLFILIEDIQWLSFPYSASLHKDLPDWLGTVLDPLRAVPDYQAFAAANIISLLFVFGVIALIAGVLTLMHRQAKVPIFALRLLRILMALIMTALSIPIATFLMMGLHCSDGKMTKFYVECFSGPHLGLFILNILGLIAFVPLLMLSVTLFVDTSPTSPSPVAKAHSRADTIDVLLRLVLVLFDVLAYKATDSFHYAFMAVAAITLAYLANHLAHTQPYYLFSMTAFRSAMCLSTSCTMAASIFIRAFVGYDTQGWWIVMVPASIAGFAAGVIQAGYYSRKFLKLKIRYWHRILKEEAVAAEQSLKNSEASLPASHAAGIRSPSSPTPPSSPVMQMPARSPHMPRRAMSRGGRGSPLKMTLDTPSTDSLGSGSPSVDPALVDVSPPNRRDTESLKSAPMLASTMPRILDSQLMQDAQTHTPPPSSHKANPRIKSALALPSPQETDDIIISVMRGTSTDALNLVKERRPPRRVNVFDNPLEVELCIRFIRENPTKKQIAIGLQLLERGLYEFPGDPLLYLLAATYMSAYYGAEGEKVADQLMKDLEQSRNNVPLDVKWLAFVRERTMRDGQTHVLDRVAQDSLQREVKFHHLRALTAVRDVWESVRTDTGAGRLAMLAAKLAFHQRAAAKCYDTLLARNRDKQTLRMFAQFIAIVEADSIRAQALLDLADGLEAAEMKRDEANGSMDPSSRSVNSLNAGNAMQNQRQGQFVLGSDPTTAALFASDDYDPTGSTQQLPADTKTNAKIAFGRSPQTMQRSPSQHGSQTSGSSTTSRTQRQRVQMRRVMLDRLTRPLKGAWWVGVCVLFFLVAVTTGFVLCMNFTSVSESKLAVEFTATRDGRRDVLNIVEGIRRMLYGNLLGNREEFDDGLKQLANHHAGLVRDLLPIINPIDALYHEQLPHIKLYHRVNVNATRVDFIPASITPVELANTIAHTGAIVLGFSEFGVLSAQHFANISSLRFLVDNFFDIYDGMRVLPSIGLQVHAEMAQQVATMIAVIMVIALVLLGVLAVVVVLAIFRQYFMKESRLHDILVAFPKRTAANLLVDIEEELESFREITQNDELDDSDLGATAVDTSNNDADDSPASSAGNGKGGRSSGPSKRRVMKYYVSLSLAFTVICACVLALFSYTLSALFSANDEADLLLKSADRRYFLSGIVVAAREFASPDRSIPTAKILQSVRTYVEEANVLHQYLIEDDALSNIFSNLTILPRDCTSTRPDPTCAGIRYASDVGFTKETASVPLNTEFSRMLDQVRELASHFLDVDAREVFRSSREAMQGWRLLEALVDDLRPRHNQLDLALSAYVVGGKRESRTWIVLIFVLVLLTSVATFVALHTFGIRKLRHEAAVLVMLLNMVPQAALKEYPELAQFIETGGLQLMM